MLRIDIFTLFPEMYPGVLGASILGRARSEGKVELNVVDLRAYTHDRRRTVDGRPYGGGAGMVMKPEPLFEAVEDVKGGEPARVILATPQGRRFRQPDAWRLSRESHIVLICGHYEGVDERVRQVLVDEELSVGDVVLTNGNLAALMITDAIVRLVPGVLGSDESALNESFDAEKLLDYPQYTRPENWRGMSVPEVLLSGNHEQITAWRRMQRRARTVARRPDLLIQAETER